ncbi:MAG: hypothetical protein IJT83_00340 [Victivallales bacterium]|nr:hypothetical protein [Victivallales bacterium]
MSESLRIRPTVVGNQTAPIQPLDNAASTNARLPVQQMPPQEEPAVEAPSARPMAQKLDSMLFKVAQVTTHSVNTKRMDTVVSGTGLSPAQRSELAAAADKAAGAFSALSKLSGRQIANALVVDKNGKFDWSNSSASRKLKEALEAQEELSDLLHNVVNDPKVTGKAFETLSEMALQADRRRTEIMSLALQLADAVQQNGDDPEVAAKLDAKMTTLLPRQALAMHGNEAALEKIKAELQPIADRLDDFATRPNSSITSEEFAALQHEMALARNALSRAGQEGFPTSDGGRWMPDRTFFSVARQFVEFAQKKLDNTRKEIGLVSVNHFVEKTINLPDGFPLVYRKNLQAVAPYAKNLAAAASLRHRMYELAKGCVKNPTEAAVKELLRLAVEYGNLKAADIEQDIELLQRMNDGGNMTKEDWNELQATFKEPRGMISQVTHLVYCIDHVNKELAPEQFLSTDSVRALMEGNLAFSTIVEARIHGMTDADVNPKLDDSNKISSETLGSGSANTVYLVKYKDGTEYVFKPEAQGRQGVESLLLTKDYKPEQQVAQLNLATQKTAEVLGLEDVMPKSTVGCHNGQYGLFMEKAPGATAKGFASGKGVSKGSLTPAQIKSLSDEQYSKVVGEIIRQTNRLEWLDLVTGQGDRHNKNYMIEVRPDLSVTVKGIDNDQCFPAYRTGLRSFHLTGTHAARFLEAYEDIIQAYPSKYREEIRNRLNSDPGVVKNKDGSIDIDATKFKSAELTYALKKATGLHGSVLPDFIDEDVYEHLQTLKEGEAREAYLADLRTRLPEEAVASAVTRLDQAIAYAESLKKAGMVISKEDFGKRDVQNRLLQRELHSTGITINPTDDQKFRLNKGDVVDKVKHQIRSLYARDIYKSLLKKGWFA